MNGFVAWLCILTFLWVIWKTFLEPTMRSPQERFDDHVDTAPGMKPYKP